MTYPNKNQILEIMSKIEKEKRHKKINKLKPLASDATPILKWKFKISQKIAEFKVVRGLSLEEMASLLNIDQGNLSRIINGHIEKVTLDKLLHYLDILLVASKNKKISERYYLSADKFFNLNEVKFA